MAKNSRAILAAGLALFISAAAGASGLPLRDPPGAAADRVLIVLSENLRFKLARPVGADGADGASWAALVNETVVMAQRLGIADDAAVAPQKRDGVYYATVAGRGMAAGRDPDQVLGRLLYMLAADNRRAAADAPIPIADRPLTATLSDIISILR